MFFYEFNTLDSFMESNFIENVKLEKNKLSKIEELYLSKKNILLNIVSNLTKINKDLNNNKLEEFYEVSSLLKSSFDELHSIIQTINLANTILLEIMALYEKGLSKNLSEIKANLVEFNKKDDEITCKLVDFEDKFVHILEYSSSFTINYSDLENDSNLSIEKNVSHDNNVLVVSEKQQKAYLPYKYSEIVKIYKNNSDIYSSLEDVVNKLYIVNLDNFKNSSISRFRECFNLIKYKEKLGVVKSLDLALELMFKHELSPIVIAACRNLEELDIYLDCLDKNELDDFDCFDIKFEVNPQIL